jgi:beta-galactosidase/beta-glucuronidase
MLPDKPLHPRPQLTREGWIDLNGMWGFAFDDENVGLMQRWMNRADVFGATITVPFPPESNASGIGDKGMHPVVWYRRTIVVGPELRGGRLLLHFGAVDYRAQVWLNGLLVAQHEGGHTPFTADISTALLDSEEQVIVVRAEDLPTDLAQPRGKQFWEAKARDIWYTRTTGIWQQVWLEAVPETYITSVRWTPGLDRGQLGMRVKLNHTPSAPLTLRVELSLHDVPLVDDRYSIMERELRRDLGLEATRTMNWRKVIWSPDYPNLVDAVITLYEGETVIDQVRSYAGLRTVRTENGYFLLNGSPVYLRLVLGQGYWEDTNLTPPSPDALYEEVRLIKALGFNGVRIHQKVEDPRFLYWCDRLGVMVWGEMANAFTFGTEAVQRLTREWMEVLERDYSHPCIICWVPLNESWGVPNLAFDPAQQSYVRALYNLTHALDQTRPVIGNDGWEHIATDVLGIHDYATDGESLRERYGTPENMKQTLTASRPSFRALLLPDAIQNGQPIMLTECGGIAYAPDPGKPWFGYGTVTDSEAFAAKYEELLNAILDSPSIVGFCYTQLTDVQQETNGLLTADRTPKVDLSRLYTITRRPSKALPGEVLVQIHQAAEAITYGDGTA